MAELHPNRVQLKASEERLRLALMAANQGLYDVNVQTGEVAVNETYAEMLGYDPATFQESAIAWKARLHPDDREKVSQIYEDYITGVLAEYRVEFRLQTATGNWKWILSLGKIVAWDESGMPLRMLGTHTDISDRKQAQLNIQFLHDLDLRLRQLTDTAAMQWEVVCSLGNYLAVDRAMWGEIAWENRQITIHRDWHRADAESHAGTYALTDFISPNLQAIHASGQPIVIADVTTHPDSIPQLATYQQLNIGAFLAVPCIREGCWVAALSVNTTTPRNWRSDEVALLQETVTRLWSLIEQSRAMQALFESELRFRSLADNIAQLTWIADQNGWIFWYNQRWFDYTGTTLDMMQGWGWQAVHHPDYIDRVVERFRQSILAGETWEDTFPLRGKDGQYRWFLSRAVPIRNEQGEVWRWFGTNTDITERKQTETALQERNDHIQLLYETTRDLLSTNQPLALIDEIFTKLKTLVELDVYINYLFNEQRQQLHLSFYGGISEDVAREIEWLEMDQAICGVVAQLRSQVVQPHVQWSTDPKTELIRALELQAYSCQPLIAQGKLFGTLGFGSRSRTEFTLTETQLFQGICDQIAIALERSQLVASLQQQTDELTKTNRLKDEFLSALSHELRTPLNPILGWTKLLQGQKIAPEQMTQALDTIERNVKHQIRLVDDLLDVSRVIQGKLRLNSHPVDLVYVLNDAIQTVEFAAQAKSLTLKFVQTPPVYTVGDGDRLGQVFWNLLSNAIKFTPDGGAVDVALSVSTGDSSYAQVRVTDTGIGIDPDFMPHVFESFRQAEGGSTRRYGGLGLGLAIVRHLVELHGGTITAESDGVGRGSSFVVKLPLLTRRNSLEPLNQGRLPAVDSALTTFATPAGDGTRATAAATAWTARLEGVRMMLVDDEPDNLELLRFLLAEEGAVVATFISPLAALQTFAQEAPDLLISDIGMPEMDGYEFIQQVRALSAQTLQPTPAIALTAFAQRADEDRALSAGYQAYITKPVDPTQVIETILQTLTNHAQD